MEPPVVSASYEPLRQAQVRPDLLDADSPSGLRVMQITGDPDLAATNIYMESHVFTPDSRRFVYQTIQKPVDRFLRAEPTKQYWLCDIEDDFALRPLTDERYVSGPAVSPDGQWMYYFVFQSQVGQPGTALKRVSLTSFERETLITFDRRLPLPEPFARLWRFPTMLYMLSTISVDGRRIALGACFGDGREEQPVMGVLVCDLALREAWVPMAACDLVNAHAQYCQATDAVTGQASRDLMIQRNSGGTCRADGIVGKLGSGVGAELLVLRDDGSDRRDLPVGLAEHEKCHGHECWLGQTTTALAGVSRSRAAASGELDRPIIQVRPVPHEPSRERRGAQHPHAEGARIDLSREQDNPSFTHFAVDHTGRHFIADDWKRHKPHEHVRLMIGTISGDAEPRLDVVPLFRPHTRVRETPYSGTQASHVHPFFSPDVQRGFFNSDYDGLPQVWMVESFDFPSG